MVNLSLNMNNNMIRCNVQKVLLDDAASTNIPKLPYASTHFSSTHLTLDVDIFQKAVTLTK